ncbi:MAG: dihydrolipoyl dehydrogenase [Lachnospiraceae bacterium]|nr:dihydrolipoyl dehydrogenase [Lachnospiraceae bacterium]
MANYYDLIIIGAGPGGYTAAIKAAGFGMKVAVIDQDKLGGVCINRGCIPTKALLYASNIFSMMQHCDEFGVSTDFISFDFAKMQDYKKRSVRKYRGEIEKLFERNGIDFIKGTATLRRERMVEVNNENGREYFQGKQIILATGAKAIMPEIPGIHQPGIINSDRLLAVTNWNYDRVVILGGGVIGVEFATIFQALCAKVTIIEKGPHLLGPMDREVSAALEKQLTKKGISIHCNTTVEEISREEGLICRIHDHTTEEESCLRASQVVVAVGRTPYLNGLVGEDVTLEMDQGRLVVDGDFQTSEPGVYAVGDMVAKTQLAHVAMAQATYVVETIAGRAHSIRLEAVPNGMYVSLPIVPNCIYTVPEIATVGITEQTAKELGMKVRCGVYTMDGNGKSIIAKEEDGFIRLIFESYSNTIVGAQMVCPRATDMIGEMATAIANGLTAKQLSRAMRAHPTYGEGITVAIEDAMKDKVEKRKIQ